MVEQMVEERLRLEVALSRRRFNGSRTFNAKDSALYLASRVEQVMDDCSCERHVNGQSLNLMMKPVLERAELGSV